MKHLRRAKLSFTFSFFEASVIVAGLIVHTHKARSAFQCRPYTTRQGERCMKDTVHHSVHLSVHFCISGSVRMRRTCALLNPHSGRGQTTVLGWNDPTLSADTRPTKPGGRSSPAVCPRMSPHTSRYTSGERVPRVKMVRNAFCTFRACHVFTFSSYIDHALNEFRQPNLQKSPRKTSPQRAGATPLFRGQAARKLCLGRSRPLLHSCASLFSPRARQPRSWPSKSQVPVKWTSPLYFTATSLATSPASGYWKSHHVFSPRKSSVGQLVCGTTYGLSDKIAYRKETTIATLEGTTQTTQVSNHSNPCRGGRETQARQIC
jgi:hypothetical protein